MSPTHISEKHTHHPAEGCWGEGMCRHKSWKYQPDRQREKTQFLRREELWSFFTISWLTALLLDEGFFQKSTSKIYCRKIILLLNYHLSTGTQVQISLTLLLLVYLEPYRWNPQCLRAKCSPCLAFYFKQLEESSRERSWHCLEVANRLWIRSKPNHCVSVSPVALLFSIKKMERLNWRVCVCVFLQLIMSELITMPPGPNSVTFH